MQLQDLPLELGGLAAHRWGSEGHESLPRHPRLLLSWEHWLFWDGRGLKETASAMPQRCLHPAGSSLAMPRAWGWRGLNVPTTPF